MASFNVVHLFSQILLYGCLNLTILLMGYEVESQFTSYDIDRMIEDFDQEIQNEKKNVPITIRVEWEQQPMSINAVVEGTADTQRYFEYIANQTDMLSLTSDQMDNLETALDGSQSFQNLSLRCEAGLQKPHCNASYPYRTYDGTCNNLRNPTWGSLFVCHRRLLPQNYEGLSGFRQSVLGGPLPNPRNLSLGIMPYRNRPTPFLSHMFLFYGQLLAHDITDTALTKVNGLLLKCCPPFVTYDFPECCPVVPALDDPFFSRPDVNQRCLQFARHAPCRTCDFTKREQMNSVTAFIDVHFTYGRTQVESDSLKMNDGSGRLISQDSPHGSLMPQNISEDDLFCVLNISGSNCFKGGDARTNQNAVLMALQVLFLREHNRLADKLKQMNPRWNEETIYQTARKILGAKMQVIAYNEYLPLLLGTELMNRYNLWIGGKYKYNSNMDPTIAAEFQAFAFRLHSFTNSQIGSIGCSKSKLRDLFRDPMPIHKGCTRDFLEGPCRTASQTLNRFLVDDITNFTIRVPGAAFGSDLAVLNIQRGRDDGLPPYSDILEYLSQGQIKVKRFEDLRAVMSSENVKLLKDMYRDVRDVDAWVGMNLEDHLRGSKISSTSAILIADQFQRLKAGDRFYFENQNCTECFNKYQIGELSKTSLSRMICDNTEVSQIAAHSLLQPSPTNPIIPCGRINNVDLRAWHE